ncbi:MAG: endonuclease domain-containing protein [Candidatus Heimdallarchaeaceae archaeon]
MKKKKIQKTCKICGKEFSVYPYRKNSAKFCSYKCYWNYLIGKAGGMKGKFHTQIAKQKISKSKLGIPNIKRRGKIVTKTTREKISKANKGKIAWNKNKKEVRPEVIEKMRKARWKYIKKVSGIICPTIGKHEKQILDEVEKELKFRIIRQYEIGGYFLDGYIPEINLAIEVDEKHHKRQKEKDTQREEFIKQKLGCQFLRIKDYE